MFYTRLEKLEESPPWLLFSNFDLISKFRLLFLSSIPEALCLALSQILSLRKCVVKSCLMLYIVTHIFCKEETEEEAFHPLPCIILMSFLSNS